MFSILLSITSVLLAAFAKPDFLAMIVHDRRSAAPEGFIWSRAVGTEQNLRLRIGLRQSNITGLQDELMEVSTPGNGRYGQHLTKEQVESYVSPTTNTSAIVDQWLASHGISSTPISPSGDWIQFSVPIDQANALINADYKVYQHVKTGKEFVRTLSYSIPEALVEHIDVIHPTTSFDNPFAHLPLIPVQQLESRTGQTNGSFKRAAQTCASAVTPACLETLYGIPAFRATQSSSTLGVSGFTDQFSSQSDLTTFLKDFRPDIPSNTTFSLETVDGGQNVQTSPGIEADLDIQLTVGLATNVPTIFVSVGDNFKDGALDGFLDIINFLLSQSNPPHVLTTSYGQNENTISQSLANSLCNAYAQLGARGTSILFSSGDGGVSGSEAGQCTTFVPTFPSGCPFLTSVGATAGNPTEVGATFTSGGFSNYFARPSYQSASVASYLSALGSTNSGKFNVSGRAYPDVSAQGENVEIVFGGQTGTVAGTSCSSPIFASVIALLNDELVDGGKSPLGFLNPLLYSAAGQAGLNDIVTGNNPGCNTNGFPARSGWDPVTGLGTPNFGGLQVAVNAATEPFYNYIPTSTPTPAV